MDKLQRQVREFHRDVLKQPYSPAPPQLRDENLRAMLIGEEAFETMCALVGDARAQTIMHAMMIKVLQERAKHKMSGPDLKEAIDGCIDTLVVTYGTLEVIGVDGEPFADEVMRSNFDKKGGPVDENGKMGKPPGWRDADIASVLAKVVEGSTPPPRESCGCDGALDDGCFNCTPSRWACTHCGFPMVRAGFHIQCIRCDRGAQLTAEQWREVAFTGRYAL